MNYYKMRKVRGDDSLSSSGHVTEVHLLFQPDDLFYLKKQKVSNAHGPIKCIAKCTVQMSAFFIVSKIRYFLDYYRKKNVKRQFLIIQMLALLVIFRNNYYMGSWTYRINQVRSNLWRSLVQRHAQAGSAMRLDQAAQGLIQ